MSSAFIPALSLDRRSTFSSRIHVRHAGLIRLSERPMCPATVIPRSRIHRRPAAVSATAAESVGQIEKCSVHMPEALRDGHDQKIILDGHKLSFDYFSGSPRSPVVFFLQGFFYSNNRRAKANALEILAKRSKYSFFVADYYGTGLSEGDFANHGTLSIWISHAVAIINRLFANRPVLLCGAGVGAWIMLHVAQHHRNIVGLVGVNSSVDFTEDLIRPGLTDEQRMEIEQHGFINLPWGRTSYPIGRALLEDGVKWLCLRGEENSLNIQCPVRLLQGLNDEEVPPSRVLKLVDLVASDDIVISFVKDSDHIFEEDRDFRHIWSAILEVAETYYEYDLTSPMSG